MASGPHTFVVMLQIRTTDPRLSQDAIADALESGDPGLFARVRRLIIKSLPRDVERVVAIFPPEHARLLMLLHEAHGEEIATVLREQGIEADSPFVRPPAGYVPPTRD
jgi:hypothetical protein